MVSSLKMQLMVKRMTYTMYYGMYRLILAEVVLTILTVMIFVPLFLFCVNRVAYINRIVRRREAFWENPKKLQDEIDRKVEKAAQKAKNKEKKKKEDMMRSAKENVEKMRTM